MIYQVFVLVRRAGTSHQVPIQAVCDSQSQKTLAGALKGCVAVQCSFWLLYSMLLIPCT